MHFYLFLLSSFTDLANFVKFWKKQYFFYIILITCLFLEPNMQTFFCKSEGMEGEKEDPGFQKKKSKRVLTYNVPTELLLEKKNLRAEEGTRKHA